MSATVTHVNMEVHALMETTSSRVNVSQDIKERVVK